MSSCVAHLTWGALTSFFPIILIGMRYIREPELNEKLLPFQYLIHLPFLYALVNLVLQTVIAPMIRQTSYSSYTQWILGALAGMIYAAYGRYAWDVNFPKNLWRMKNPDNIYFSMIFYWALIYGMFLTYLQRQVCYHGPRGF